MRCAPTTAQCGATRKEFHLTPPVNHAPVVGGGRPDCGRQPCADQFEECFLAIDGLNGGSTDAKHVGWFEVSSYDVSALVAALAGKATFSPLTVTFAQPV